MDIVLDQATFWRLRALAAAKRTAELEAQQALAAAQAALERQQAFFADVAGRYHFDPTTLTFALDDDTCTLTLPDVPAKPAAKDPS